MRNGLGTLEVVFTQWSEYSALDDDDNESFTWSPGVKAISIELAAPEAIGGYQPMPVPLGLSTFSLATESLAVYSSFQ